MAAVSAGASVQCTPGAILFYTWSGPGYTTTEGVCPAVGTYVCGQRPSPYGGQVASYYGPGVCTVGPAISAAPSFELVTWASGGSGAAASTTVTFGEPFNLSAADGALVAAAICALWSAAWGMRTVRRALDGPGDTDGGS